MIPTDRILPLAAVAVGTRTTNQGKINGEGAMGMNIDDIALHSVGGLKSTDIEQTVRSRLALVCPAGTPAADAIAIATENTMPLIFVTAELAHPPHRDLDYQYKVLPGNPNRVVCGVVEPTHLRQALTTFFRQTSEPLLDIVREYEKDTNQAERRWRHEWLNRQGVVLQFCDKGGGHLTTLPCRYHSATVQAVW